MGRKPCCSKEEGLNRGAWTAMEDQILSDYINAHGEGKWRSLPKAAGLKRCGKSCRLRWLNYLRPDIKRGNITSDEEDLIIRLHKLLGNRWSLIAGRLPGRTDNEIKNYWNTVLSKRAKEKQLDRTNKYEKKQRVISWSRKSPTGSGSGSGGVIHAKAKSCTTKVFITPQQQVKTANDKDNVIRSFPSIDAKLVHETAAVESDSSGGSKEENPSSKFTMGSCNGEISRISEALLASDEFKQLKEFDLCDMNTRGIFEYGMTNDCGQALWSPLGMVENWSVNDCVELEANFDSDFGFLATFLDQSTKDHLII